jgi:hypothetical protein
LLIYAGLVKIRDDRTAAAFFESLTLVDAPGVITTLALLEIAVGGLLVLRVSVPRVSRVALALATAFLTTHLYAATLEEPPPPCGCLGATLVSTEGQSASPIHMLLVTAGMMGCAMLVAVDAGRRGAVWSGVEADGQGEHQGA